MPWSKQLPKDYASIENGSKQYMLRHLPDPAAKEIAMREGTQYPIASRRLGGFAEGGSLYSPGWEWMPLDQYWQEVREMEANSAPVVQSEAGLTEPQKAALKRELISHARTVLDLAEAMQLAAERL